MLAATNIGDEVARTQVMKDVHEDIVKDEHISVDRGGGAGVKDAAPAEENGILEVPGWNSDTSEIVDNDANDGTGPTSDSILEEWQHRWHSQLHNWKLSK